MSAVASTLPIQAMKMEKVKEHIGAIVTGIDLAQPIDGATQQKLFECRLRDIDTVAQQGQERILHYETVGQVMLGVTPENIF